MHSLKHSAIILGNKESGAKGGGLINYQSKIRQGQDFAGIFAYLRLNILSQLKLD